MNMGRGFAALLQTITSFLKAFLAVFSRYPYYIPSKHKKPSISLIDTLERYTGAPAPYRPRRFPEVSSRPEYIPNCYIFVTKKIGQPSFAPKKTPWVCVIFQKYRYLLDRGDFYI